MYCVGFPYLSEPVIELQSPFSSSVRVLPLAHPSAAVVSVIILASGSGLTGRGPTIDHIFNILAGSRPRQPVRVDRQIGRDVGCRSKEVESGDGDRVTTEVARS